MHSKILFTILLLFLSAGCISAAELPFNYTSAWKEIDNMKSKVRPASMLDGINTIYQTAVEEHNAAQQIKATIYLLALQHNLYDVSDQKTIDLLQNNMEQATFPAKAVFQSLLGEVYWQYLDYNKYRIGNRSDAPDADKSDIATWSRKDLIRAAIYHYGAALENAAGLQKINISEFKDILEPGNTESAGMRQTLYDLLAHRAIDTYAKDGDYNQPADITFFDIDNPAYLIDANSFADMTIVPEDSLSMRFQTLKLYQDLIRFHLQDRDPEPLAVVDIERLRYLVNYTHIPSRVMLYKAALEVGERRCHGTSASTQYTYRLAYLENLDTTKAFTDADGVSYLFSNQRAMALCETAIAAFPNSFGGISCQSLKEGLLSKYVGLFAEEVILPNQTVKLMVSIRNVTNVKLRVFRISMYAGMVRKGYEYAHENDAQRKEKIRKLLQTRDYTSESYTFPDEGDYQVHSYEVPLKNLTSGRYIMVLLDENESDFEKQSISTVTIDCTRLGVITKENSNNVLMVLNRLTGKPMSGVNARLYANEYTEEDRSYDSKLRWTGVSGSKGLLAIPTKNRIEPRLLLSQGADSLWVTDLSGIRYTNPIIKKWHCLVMTDRAIYRPGQTVYCKGFLYEADNEHYYKVKPQSTVKVTFTDANHQEIASKQVISDNYGGWDCTFTAPAGVLTGKMSIYVTRIDVAEDDYNNFWVGGAYFNVEEYKRPTFEVKVEAPKETYRLGMTVNMTGKAVSYAGVPLDGANVRYWITPVAVMGNWGWWADNRPKTYPSGTEQSETITDANGEFRISFLTEAPDKSMYKGETHYAYTITAEVTDVNGETRTGYTTVFIGEKELLLNTDLGTQINRDMSNLSLPLSSTNMKGDAVGTRIKVVISRLKSPEHMLRINTINKSDRDYLSRDEYHRLFPYDAYTGETDISLWEIDKEVYTQKFDTAESDTLFLRGINTWQDGEYKLIAETEYNGQHVTLEKYFTLYSKSGTTLPYPMDSWFVPVKTICEPGETAEVLIGSSYSDVTVFYGVERNHKLSDSLSVVLNSEQRLFRVPVRESDRGSFYVHFTFVRDNRVYSFDQEITVPWSNKKIEVEYLTFRDKLTPGSKEKWRIKLKDKQDGAVLAEVLASMYDASLDALTPHSWRTNIYGKIMQSCGWTGRSFNQYIMGWTLNQEHRGTWAPYMQFSKLNWFSNRLQWDAGRGRNVMMSKTEISSVDQIEDDNNRSSALEAEDKTIANEANTGSGGEEPELDLSGIRARNDFSETAFFYPKLFSDARGEVSIEFDLPESLTKWRFMTMAVSKELQLGYSEKFAVSQKPLMVTSNPPRFFREGDKITFTAKIAALGNADQTGECRLYMTDALTGQSVDTDFGLSSPQKKFSVVKGESAVVEWNMSIPAGISAVTYKVVAQAGEFSDGEENVIPVLSNRMLVTESLPMPVRGNSSKTFTFDKLKNSGASNTLQNHKLTLEFTSNPAWYAVQALPYMMEFPYDCNEQIFTRYYANSIASFIADSSPRLKKVFDSWKNNPDKSALLSNLEKNQELKSVILEETPWVMDAKNESESKQRVGTLFDTETLSRQLEANLALLKKNQSAGGGWSWFQGMPDSWWVTQYIVEGLGHLEHLGISSVQKDRDYTEMVQKAVQFIDAKILQDYRQIMLFGHSGEDNLGVMEMHYLYARSFFAKVPLQEETQAAVDYFHRQAAKYWQHKDIYGQGLIALAEYRGGNKITPSEVLTSLRERALHSEEMGMYWKDNRPGWFWYQAPIETQSLIIEAFNDIAKDRETVDELRIWLLKQKQTTNWKTTKATAEACYALLLSGTEWLDTKQLATINVGGKTIDPTKLPDTKVEAGTGYFKTSWTGDDIKPQQADIRVTNPNPGPAWGAMYWQYFEDLDKITPADTGLKLKKELYIERTTDKGVVLELISDKSLLHVGDKVIVRIELRSDRDMEYVHMKDLRSAGFEPINVLSNYKHQDGLGYYEATGDAATNFFIEYLAKGTYVFEYPLRVNNKGDFSNGVTTIQCMYAPEFTAHSEGIRVEVK